MKVRICISYSHGMGSLKRKAMTKSISVYEYGNGNISYWNELKLHRERLDGPAWISSNGMKEYYINNKEYSYSDYKKEIEKNYSHLKFIKVGNVSVIYED